MTRIFLAVAVTLALAATAQAATPTLNGVVGPGFSITLTQGGKKVTVLKAGAYVIKVSDKASIHDFHLKGPGVNKATAVPGTGNATWKVTLRKGSYTFVCDAHPTLMIGHFRVS